jgi:hypothetical protein
MKEKCTSVGAYFVVAAPEEDIISWILKMPPPSSEGDKNISAF